MEESKNKKNNRQVEELVLFSEIKVMTSYQENGINIPNDNTEK
jgi:hypothetical protein